MTGLQTPAIDAPSCHYRGAEQFMKFVQRDRGPWHVVLNDLESLWVENKNSDVFKEALLKLFNSCRNAYRCALYLCFCSQDYGQVKASGTFASTIIKEFLNWIKVNAREQLLTKDVKRFAFVVGTWRHTLFLEQIFDCFQLEPMAEEFLPDINTMVAKSYFKDAAVCVTYFNLHQHFSLDQILIPCILQDRLNVAENYLKNQPQLQQEVLQILDRLITPGYDIHDFLSRFSYVPQIHRNKFHWKTLGKLVARWAKMFNIASTTVPNLTNSRACGALGYIMYRHYNEKTMDRETFRDFICQSLRDCPMALHFIIDKLCMYYGDLREAALLVRLSSGDLRESAFHVVDSPLSVFSIKELPPQLIEFMAEQTQEEIDNDILNADVRNGCDWLEDSKGRSFAPEEGEYLQMPDHICSNIVFVDTKAKLDELLMELEGARPSFAPSSSIEKEEEILLGLDSEWGPVFTGVEKVAILQVALRHRVFIVDILSLRENEHSLSDADWIDFLERIFQNPKLLKLGFHFSNDVNTLLSTFPFAKHQLQNMQNMVCLQILAQKLSFINPDFTKGLTDLIAKSNVNSKTTPTPNTEATIDIANFAEATTADLDSEEASNNGISCTSAMTISNEVNDVCDTATEDSDFKTTVECHKSKILWSLSDLCHYFLGRPLQKSDCFSNWARRPLRPRQLYYAALDAFCQIQLYERMCERAKELEIDFREVIEGVTVATDFCSTKKVKKSADERRFEKATMYENVVKVSQSIIGDGAKRPQEVRLVVDGMLTGLGKSLRRCGVDCRILAQYEPREMCLEYAAKEQRVILTSGTYFLNRILTERVSQQGIAVVPKSAIGTLNDQLIWVINYFKLLIDETDIFSRCTLCNCASFIFATSEQLRKLRANLCDFRKSSTQNSSLVSHQHHIDPQTACEQQQSYGIEDISIDMRTGFIWGSRQRIQLEAVLCEVLDSVEQFYVCQGCGKVYWEGQHHVRCLKNMSGVLEDSCRSSLNNSRNAELY